MNKPKAGTGEGNAPRCNHVGCVRDAVAFLPKRGRAFCQSHADLRNDIDEGKVLDARLEARIEAQEEYEDQQEEATEE